MATTSGMKGVRFSSVDDVKVIPARTDVVAMMPAKIELKTASASRLGSFKIPRKAPPQEVMPPEVTPTEESPPRPEKDRKLDPEPEKDPQVPPAKVQKSIL
jgi:hypothetical protein